ncbi:MAG: hypothetical protein HC769_35120 [Cyanobacteria bacterium CRU_2_1]|nr:hypothetical protein [Cyanobacteria bacterium CRU_2_1]
MASTDSAYRSRLKERALQVSDVMELDDPPNPQCEFCTIVIEKEGEPPQVHCGTKDECDVLAGWFFLILIAWGLAELFDWLF